MGFWDKFGQYAMMAAPFVAAPFTGGASIPVGMAISGGIGAGKALVNGGGAKEALMGGALGAGAGALSGTMSSAANNGSAAGDATTAPGDGYIPGTQEELMGAAPSNLSFWDKMGSEAKRMSQDPDVWRAGGVALGNLSRQRSGERERRIEHEGSDLRKMQQTDAIIGSKNYVAPNGLPQYGFGPQAASSRTKEAASELQDELVKRLMQGGTTPGVFDQILDVAAPAMSLYGNTRRK